MPLCRLLPACLWLLTALPSGAAELVHWCQFDLPPMYIVHGPYAGQGLVDGHVTFLMQQMSEFRHEWQFSNIARAAADIRRDQPLICGGMQRNAERETYMHFSLPFFAFPPPLLLLPASRAERLKPWRDSKGAARLTELITSSGLVLGVSSGRSYGHIIDAQLSALGNHPNIIERSPSANVGEGLVRMMQIGRLDMVIAFEGEERIYREGYPDPKDPLTTLPIAGVPAQLPAYFVAPRNEWGHRMIDRINTLLRQHWNNPEFRRSAFRQMDAEERKRTEAMLRELDPNRRQ